LEIKVLGIVDARCNHELYILYIFIYVYSSVYRFQAQVIYAVLSE